MSDDVSDRVTASIAEAIKAGELGEDTTGMPAQWVMVCTYYDSQGETQVALLTNEGARTHETLGLLELGSAAWREEARRWVMGNPDSEAG